MEIQSDVAFVVNLFEGTNKCITFVFLVHNAVRIVCLCCRHEARLSTCHGGRFGFSRCKLSRFHRGRIVVGALVAEFGLMWRGFSAKDFFRTPSPSDRNRPHAHRCRACGHLQVLNAGMYVVKWLLFGAAMACVALWTCT